MKKINFKSVSSTLSQKEMKNVLGGSVYFYCFDCDIGRGALFGPDRNAIFDKFAKLCPGGGSLAPRPPGECPW